MVPQPEQQHLEDSQNEESEAGEVSGVGIIDLTREETGEEEEAGSRGDDEGGEDSDNFKTPLGRLPLEVFPETPVRRRHLRRRRGRRDCPCEIQETERKWNNDTPTVFYSQVRHTRFLSYRKKLKPEQLALSSEFAVGREMKLIVGLLKEYDNDLEPPSKVILTFTTGANEIRFHASRFLSTMITEITEKLMTSSSKLKIKDYPVLNVSLEYYEDALTDWICLRRYLLGYVAEQIYISSVTWTEVRALAPLLANIADSYTNIVMMERARMPLRTQEEEEEEEDESPSKLRRASLSSIDNAESSATQSTQSE